MAVSVVIIRSSATTCKSVTFCSTTLILYTTIDTCPTCLEMIMVDNKCFANQGQSLTARDKDSKTSGLNPQYLCPLKCSLSCHFILYTFFFRYILWKSKKSNFILLDFLFCLWFLNLTIKTPKYSTQIHYYYKKKRT